jgi:hypothetical protein
MIAPAKSQARLYAAIVFVFALLPMLTPTLLAQQHEPVQRVIEGKVVAKSGAPIKGAIVYLKDDHTASIKSAITGDDGSYRFGQLSLSTDYELWAAIDAKKSSTRTISSFDSKAEFHIDLKIDM